MTVAEEKDEPIYAQSGRTVGVYDGRSNKVIGKVKLATDFSVCQLDSPEAHTQASDGRIYPSMVSAKCGFVFVTCNKVRQCLTQSEFRFSWLAGLDGLGVAWRDLRTKLKSN